MGTNVSILRRLRLRLRLPLLAALACVAGWLALAAPADAQTVSPTTEVYAAGTAASTQEGTRIDAGAGPGGVFMRYALQPSKRYRVTVGGSPLDGTAMTMRAAFGDGAYHYDQAADGTLRFTVSGRSELELLFYADEPSTYLLRSLDVEECSDCASDADLKNLILHDVPGLSDLLAADHYEAAKAILHWAAPRVPFAGTPPAPLSTELTSAADMYFENFASARAGVLCGGAADFLVRTLRLFGIDAMRIDIGRGGVEHSTVVLARPQAAAWRFDLLDPTFDLTIENVGGAPLDLLSAWSRLADGRPESVEVRTGDLTSRDIVLPADSSLTCDGFASATPCSLSSYLRGYLGSLVANGYRLDAAAELDVIQMSPPNVVRGGTDAQRAAFTGALDSWQSDPRLAASRGAPKPVSAPQVDPAAQAAAGKLVVGQVIHPVAAHWASVQPLTPLSLTLERCNGGRCVPIAGSAAYVVRAADVGASLRVTDRVANAFGEQRRTSSMVSVAGDARRSMATTRSERRARIVGRARAGRVLRCVGAGARVRWYRDRRALAAPTGTRRRVRRSDAGHSIACGPPRDRKRVSRAVFIIRA